MSNVKEALREAHVAAYSDFSLLAQETARRGYLPDLGGESRIDIAGKRFAALRGLGKGENVLLLHPIDTPADATRWRRERITIVYRDGRQEGAQISAETIRVFAEGTDVSGYQHPDACNWAVMRRDGGIVFAYVKASEGEQQIRHVERHLNGARGAGILASVYHFLRPGVDGADQARFFKALCHKFRPDMPPALDIEEHPLTGEVQVTWSDVQDFLQEWGDLPLVIYTSGYMWGKLGLPNDAAIAGRDLWQADYNEGKKPPWIHAPWSNWRIHQTEGGTGRIKGYVPAKLTSTAGIDRNRFNGDVAELRAWAQENAWPVAPVPIQPVTPQVPTEQVMYDMAAYMRGNGGLMEMVMIEADGSQASHRLQTQAEPGSSNAWFLTKGNEFGAEYESLAATANHIMRGFDGSPGKGKAYSPWQNGRPWATWCPRFMFVGQVWEGAGHYVQRYFKKGLRKIRAGSGDARNRCKLTAHYPTYTNRYGLVFHDVIELTGLHSDGRLGEVFLFARGLGMIGWSAPGWYELPGESAVAEIHQPGQRPSNKREVILGADEFRWID